MMQKKNREETVVHTFCPVFDENSRVLMLNRGFTTVIPATVSGLCWRICWGSRLLKRLRKRKAWRCAIISLCGMSWPGVISAEQMTVPLKIRFPMT